jgi:hypothetical protein
LCSMVRAALDDHEDYKGGIDGFIEN